MRKILPFALINLRYAYSGSLKAQFTVEGGGQVFVVDADDSADGYSWFSAAVDGGHLAHCQLVRIDQEVLCLMDPGSIPAPSFSPVPDGTSHEEGSVGIVVADGVVTALAFNVAPGTRGYCTVGTMTAEDLAVLRDVATQVDRAERGRMDSMLREGRRYVSLKTAEIRNVVAIASDGPAAHPRKLRSSMGVSNVVPLPAPSSSLTQPHILIGGKTTMIPKTMDRGEFNLPPPSAIRFGPLPAWPTRPVYEDIEADGSATWGYVGGLLMLLTVLLGVVYRKEVEQVVEEASQVDHSD
ncbi:hypothetical protein FOZ61_001601 [Perkinsus olseni]|uniref:Uncharacterized protein n=1 Tax=Perkinsus olseni TaxID=32597 RepID=A0A7J6MHM0_PEROL|nr:hypothetical protein FOZ61_001601 [Perkinsus olseni]KAF4671089.1 hypothetical protein FOL46_000510 [Perkinsus olseni]